MHFISFDSMERRRYRISYSKMAQRDLLKMPCDKADLVTEKIEQLALDPLAYNPQVKKLKGLEGYRLRVGDWRVIYDLVKDELVIHVIRVGIRGNIYKQMIYKH